MFYYKFASQTMAHVQKTPTLNAWCIRHTEYKRKNYGGNCQDAIAQYKKQNDQAIIDDFIKGKHEQYPTYRPAFMSELGQLVGLYNSLDDLDDFIKLIKPTTHICSICGKEFAVNSKTKRKICDECYTKYRKNQINQNSKKYYRKKKVFIQEKGKSL